MPGRVEPTIFTQAKPSQIGSNPDLLELSWAKKLKFDIAQAELSQEGSNLIMLEPSWAKKLKFNIAWAEPKAQIS